MKSTFASVVRTFPASLFFEVTYVRFLSNYSPNLQCVFSKNYSFKNEMLSTLHLYLFIFIILGDLSSNKYTFMWKPHNTLNAT